jgi:hypothetical protein
MPKPRSKRKQNPDTDGDRYPGPIGKGKRVRGSSPEMEADMQDLEGRIRAAEDVAEGMRKSGNVKEAKIEEQFAREDRAKLEKLKAAAKSNAAAAPLTAAETRKLMDNLPDDIDPDELTAAEKRALINK